MAKLSDRMFRLLCGHHCSLLCEDERNQMSHVHCFRRWASSSIQIKWLSFFIHIQDIVKVSKNISITRTLINNNILISKFWILKNTVEPICQNTKSLQVKSRYLETLTCKWLPLISNHRSSATSLPKYQKFPSQITIFVTSSCKQPWLLLELNFEIFLLFLTYISNHLTRDCTVEVGLYMYGLVTLSYSWIAQKTEPPTVLSISTDGRRKASATSLREVGYFFP